MASIINNGGGFTDNDIKWDEFQPTEQESGRGLKLIKRLCDKVEFKRTDSDKFEVHVEFNMDIAKRQIK